MGCSGLQGKRWNGDSNFLADIAIVTSLLAEGHFVYWIGFDTAECMIPDSVKSQKRFQYISLPFDLKKGWVRGDGYRATEDGSLLLTREVCNNYSDLNSNYDEFKMVERFLAFLKSDRFQQIELDFLIKDYQKVVFTTGLRFKERDILPFPVINQVHLTQSFIMQECAWEGFGEDEVMNAALYDAFEYSSAAANIFASEYNRDVSLGILGKYVSPAVIELIRDRCHVVPFPFLDINLFEAIRKSRSFENKEEVVIVFPHRLNSDRNPGLLLSSVRKILESEPNLKLKVVLCKGDHMKIKASIKEDYEWLKSKGVIFTKSEFLGEPKSAYNDSSDMEKDKEKYVRTLSQSDIVVCSSRVESFGISFREAVFCGAYPLLHSGAPVYRQFTDISEFLTDDAGFCLALRKLIEMVRTQNAELNSRRTEELVRQQSYLSPEGIGKVYTCLFDKMKNPIDPTRVKGKTLEMVSLIKESPTQSMTKWDFMKSPKLSWVNPNDFSGLKDKMLAVGVVDDLDQKVPTYRIVS